MPVDRRVALLRGVNVGGHRRVPMADLRALAEGLGFTAVETYVQSGNLVFGSLLGEREAARALEAAIEARLGFPVDVMVRTAPRWHEALASMPWPEAAEDRPERVHLCLCREPAAPGAAAALSRLCAGGEAVHQAGDVLWIDYAQGVGRSRLTPVALDRAAGSPVTARNWRTALRLRELLDA